MDIKVKTLYDRKTLLDFNSYYVMKKAVLMWVIAISNVLIIAEWITLLALSADIGKVMYVISALILAIDVFYFFLYFILPRTSVKKNKLLGTVLNYNFRDGGFFVKAKNKYIDEELTIRYSEIVEVGRGKRDLYLFLAANQAYIVDLTEVSAEDKAALKEKLLIYVSAKKIKWNAD